MIKKWMIIFSMMTIFVSPVFAQDWGISAYDTYEPGFYDSTTSDLYNDSDDWFYDNYTLGDSQQREEDDALFDQSSGWESDTDLFGPDTFGEDTDI